MTRARLSTAWCFTRPAPAANRWNAWLDSGMLVGVIDVTTTEVCDHLVGGVLSAGPDRLGAIARSGIPYVGSVARSTW